MRGRREVPVGRFPWLFESQSAEGLGDLGVLSCLVVHPTCNNPKKDRIAKIVSKISGKFKV